MSLTDERIKERPTSKAEPMDWSTTRSETSLPSPVRSRSRSGSPSPPRAITINLFPLSDSIEFAPKHLSFNPDQEIKVGRVSGSRNQKEAKPDNGVFSCDVMSREHALLKEENGKILIKDLKSTHGTFVNNVRLGDGTEESDWRTLNHGDVITFGHSVRRNQNLYKHLSVYIFYPKETRDDIHSPSNGTTPVEPISSPPTIKVERVERVERTSENVLLPPSAITQEATSVANTGVSQSSMLQSKNEGPASYYIAKSGGLSSNTSNATPLGNKFGGLPVTKPRTTDNITQASEALVTESKQNSTTSNTSEEMLTSIQKLKIGQPDEKSHTKVEKVENKELAASSQEDDGDVYMENNEDFKSNNVESEHKLVSPEITPETNPVGVPEEATVIQTATRTTTTVSFVAPAPVKDRVTTQVTRETKQSKVSRKEKESRENNVDKDDNEHIVVSNGEGPSHVTEDDSSTTSSITSRKRKFDEVEDDEDSGLEVVNNLKEKIAALEDRANKRRKRDMVYSCVIGMVAGAFSIGACAYVFGA